MRRWFVITALLLPLTSGATPALSTQAFEQEIFPFFSNTCLDCHDDDTQKGERQFDGLAFPIVDDNMLIDFQDALDQLNLGEMPPKKKKQPDPAEKTKIIAWLTAAIAQTQAERTVAAGETVLRRLNQREYLNTMVDLFNLQITGFNPVVNFPADQKVHHLDNQGQALVTSGFLLDQYLSAADQIVEKALPPLNKPDVHSWEFTERFRQQPELDSRRIDMEILVKTKSRKKEHRRRLAQLARYPNTKKTKEPLDEETASLVRDIQRMPKTLRLYTNPQGQRHMGSHGHLSDFTDGVPVDGFYDISIWAEAKFRHADLPKEVSTDPYILAIVPGDRNYGDLHLPQPLEPELARFTLQDEKIVPYHAKRIWLDKGHTPRFTFPNGPAFMRAPLIKAGKELLKARGVDEKSIETEAAFLEGIAYAERPQIWIHKVTIKGPYYEAWPRPTQKQLIGGTVFDPEHNPQNIAHFLNKAYRRPASQAEVDQILSVIAHREKQGHSPFDAYQDGLKAALCSPSFLYLEETPTAKGKLGSDAIASRLSYFLWASMPDHDLLDLAKADKLRDPKVRLEQVERMLKDPRSDRFINGFLNSWLTLGALGETPPDRSAFGLYYTANLEEAMRTETRMFTRHILDNNLSIDNFLDSDFTFMNADLATLYNFKQAFEGNEFVLVSTKGHMRGGLLAQASVLTVSANGVDTSPVVRGVWLLENILGTPPPPPPPDVEALNPDTRGATSMRDMLERHRSDPACSDCHQRIDPLGFALEQFDPIGRFRGRYPNKSKVETAGVLPSGETFKNFEEFKAVMMKDRDKFAKALIEKLISYSCGREIQISDRPTTDALLSELDENGRGLRFMIRELVASELFISP